VLLEAKLVTSKSEARRVLEQGGVKVDSQVIKDADFKLKPGMVIQKGKLHYLKII